MEEVKEFIIEHVNKTKILNQDLQLSWWNAYTKGHEEDYKKYSELKNRYKWVYNNKEEFNKIKNWLSEDISNSLLKRQLKVLYNLYLSCQGEYEILTEITERETKIEKKFNSFRPKIGNEKVTDNQINKIMTEETDSRKLQVAWEASKKQGEEVANDLLEIIALRNNLAVRQGFNNYYEMMLEASEQKEYDIAKIFKEVEKITDSSFKELKKEIDSFLISKLKIKYEELAPWHYQDLFFQESPRIYNTNLNLLYKEKDFLEIVKEFYNKIGLPVEKIIEKSDLYERTGKSQHAFCIDIDRKGDIRALTNLKKTEKWMETLLHELGHGVYWLYMKRDLPYVLRQEAHTLTTEAIAQFFGRQSKNRNFLKTYCKVEREEDLKDLEKMLKLRQVIFSRWSQVMVNFEMSLYQNPNQDLNKLWWELVRKYQGINFYRDKPDWASKIHFISAPVYYHNYLLGELMASQINNFLVKRIMKENKVQSPDYVNKLIVGEYLKKSIFDEGMNLPWNELIKKSTGEYLQAKYFAEEFCEK